MVPKGGPGPHLGLSLLVIDGSFDGDHKLSIDINGLIYDWNHDWWWKPRTVRSVMVMMSRGGTSKFGNVATLLFSVCGVPKHTISIRVFFFFDRIFLSELNSSLRWLDHEGRLSLSPLSFTYYQSWAHF